MPVWLSNAWLWVQANPWTTTAIVVYLIVNLAPRPHPEQREGWAKTFWTIVDRLSVLTAGSVPGKLKMIFSDSPADGPKAPTAKSTADAVAKAKAKTKKSPKKKDEPKEPPKDKPKDAPKDEPEVEVDGPGADSNQGKDGSGT